ncbi:MAG: lamin tail domain-containing protein, partial [Planctomycetota bacterium]
MSPIRLSLLAACVAAAATPAFAQRVVINEFSYDDSSTDDLEFVELYNADSVAVDMSNWVLASQDPVGANASFTIPAGTVLAPGAFYVLGSGLVPNVSQIVGVSNIWENSNETLEL